MKNIIYGIFSDKHRVIKIGVTSRIDLRANNDVEKYYEYMHMELPDSDHFEDFGTIYPVTLTKRIAPTVRNFFKKWRKIIELNHGEKLDINHSRKAFWFKWNRINYVRIPDEERSFLECPSGEMSEYEFIKKALGIWLYQLQWNIEQGE